jgi:4-hydroxybenzoate polyprenyltransferase
MGSTLLARPLPLLRSSHPGPTVVVTVVALVLGAGVGLGAARLVLLVLVVLFGQLSIGWSNDWLDAGRDTAVHRPDKPVATGGVRISTVRTAAFVAAAASILLSLPLGPAAAGVNLVCFGMGWVYNLGAKGTVASILPYLVCFGLLPAVATLSLDPPRLPAVWIVAAGALLGAAAHLTNVLPDLEDDRITGIRGLPHVIGARPSGVLAFLALVAAAALVAFGPTGTPGPVTLLGLGIGVAIAVAGIALTVARRPTRLLMRLIMAGAVVDVAMLAIAQLG